MKLWRTDYTAVQADTDDLDTASELKCAFQSGDSQQNIFLLGDACRDGEGVRPRTGGALRACLTRVLLQPTRSWRWAPTTARGWRGVSAHALRAVLVGTGCPARQRS